jgi:hypothetical protein
LPGSSGLWPAFESKRSFGPSWVVENHFMARTVSAIIDDMSERKFPIGIQDFVRLREEGYWYVDKTALLHKMVNSGSVYFLSRPRRFGKSLLLSTLGAWFDGRCELFEGLALEKLVKDWTPRPVLRLDLNPENYISVAALEGILAYHVRRWEDKWGAPSEPGESLGQRFLGVIERAHEQSGQRVAILIDEYDKPLLSTIGQTELHEAYKGILKAFYGVLKSADAHLKFALITGVTKFGQVSVFSDLNQITDLTLHPAYATLCGLTEAELLRDFHEDIVELAAAESLEFDACLEKIRRWYNGYRFEEKAEGVYNPFSTLNLLSRQKFEPFWFATGTPTFLVELLKRSDYDLRDLEGVQLPANQFADYRADPDRPLPVIYQSGYLTIKGYDPELKIYTLGFPNDEVAYGFLHFLADSYLYEARRDHGLHISRFVTELREGKPEAFLERLKIFFAGIPYDLSDRTERHYQVVFYLVFRLLGQFMQSEVKSARGRADAVVETRDQLYVFEFKLDGSAEQALAQIDGKGYLLPYTGSGAKLWKIGVEFDAAARNIGRWIIAKA